MKAYQFEMHLPARPADDVLRDRLAAAVEQLNARTDLEPGAVVALKAEIDRLRFLLSSGGAS